MLFKLTTLKKSHLIFDLLTDNILLNFTCKNPFVGCFMNQSEYCTDSLKIQLETVTLKK